MPYHEGSTETGGKRGFWFCDSHFSASDFCGITTDEVVHSLRRTEFADRWQYTKSITSKENYILWMPTYTRNFCVQNKVDRIRGTCIFSVRGSIVIDNVGFFVIIHIFQHSTKTDCFENIRLFFFRKIDALCVAAAFNIENSIVGPAVFIIPNKLPFWICRKGRFSCSGQTKKDSYISGFSHICGTMH